MEDFKSQFDKAINDYATKNQYGVSKIPYHMHNGTDSPPIDYNTLVNKPTSLYAFDPTTSWYFYEDFLGGDNTSGSIGTNGWTSADTASGTATFSGQDGEDAHPGIFEISKPNGINENGALYVAQSTNMQSGTHGGYTMIACIKLAQLNKCYCQIGIAKEPTNDTPTGIYFWYDEQAGTSSSWYGRTQNGVSYQLTSGSSAGTTDWVRLKMVMNSDFTSCEFFVAPGGINEVSIGTVTSPIPTQKAYPFINLGIRENVGKSVKIDYYYLTGSNIAR